VSLIKQRECGDCNMCCKLPNIDSGFWEKSNTHVFKGQYEWCKHCEIGVGCKIYSKRPSACRDFYCLYQAGMTNLKPNKNGFFMYLERKESAEQKVITIMCEEHRLDLIPKLIMNDLDGYMLVDKGWTFHIRYNSNDNDLAIFDLKLFGMELKKVKRNIPFQEQINA
jgi:hypothetical protein